MGRAIRAFDEEAYRGAGDGGGVCVIFADWGAEAGLFKAMGEAGLRLWAGEESECLLVQE
jgi:hypothetical protein